MTILGQDWAFFFRRKHYLGRQSALSYRGMTILGQDWVFFFRRKHSVGRQSAPSYRGITNLSQDWVFFIRRKHPVGRQSAISYRGMTILGQDWVFFFRRKHSVSRQSTISYRGITILGQEWVFSIRRKHYLSCQHTIRACQVRKDFWHALYSIIVKGTCTDYLIITFLPSMMYIPFSSDWISLPTYWPLMVKMRVSLCSSAFIVLMPTVPISPWLVLLAQDD